MYLDSSPVAAPRSRRRGDCRKPARQTPVEHPRRDTTAARRTRVDDAIVSQWLLDLLPVEHRHALAR